jgi:hypothetical protein
VLDCSGEDRDNPLARGRSGKIPFTEALSSRSSVICDLDGDGDLDIVTLDMDDRPQILISNLAQRRPIHYLKIKLIGAASNHDGLGATVRVYAGGRTLTQYNDGKSGYFGQSVMPLYFGLGEAGAVERIEIQWPSGKKQVVSRDVGVNRLMTITESAAQ